MYKLNDLTDIILQVRQTSAKNNDLLLRFLDIIEDLYANDVWIFCPSTSINNKESFSIAKNSVGRFLVILSDKKYFRNKYGTNIVFISIRKVFEMYFEDNDLDGIIINADTDAEILLQRQVIDTLNLWNNTYPKDDQNLVDNMNVEFEKAFERDFNLLYAKIVIEDFVDFTSNAYATLQYRIDFCSNPDIVVQYQAAFLYEYFRIVKKFTNKSKRGNRSNRRRCLMSGEVFTLHYNKIFVEIFKNVLNYVAEHTDYLKYSDIDLEIHTPYDNVETMFNILYLFLYSEVETTFDFSTNSYREMETAWEKFINEKLKKDT